jgi:hypothetical protein
MPSRNFLFVNKDASSNSLTRSSINEQSSINSHVQRGRRHVRSTHVSSRRRPPAASKEKSPADTESSATASSPSNSSTSSGSVPLRTSSTGFSSFLLNPDVSPTDTSPVHRPPYHGFHQFQSDALDHAAITRIRTAQQTSDDLISIASPNAQAESDSKQTTPSTAPTSLQNSPHDISQLVVNSIDPFQRASISIDFKAHQLLEYYKLVYHPAVWHAETRASPKGSYTFQTSATQVIQSALASDVDMYALLACMASRLEYIDRQPGQGTDEYLGKALAATRKLLMQRASHEPKSNEEILMIIFHLYAAEGYRNNAAAAKIHMKGAKTIVQCIGGLAKLRDPQMRELLITGDGLLSAMTLQPCELPCEFDPGSYLKATPSALRFAAKYDLSAIAPALRDRSEDSIIPLTMANVIDETTEINWVLQQAKHGSPEASKHAMRWLQIRNMAVRHRLLGLSLPDHRLDAFRAALVLWIVTTTTLLGQQRLGARIAPQVQLKLKAASSHALDWEGDTDVQAWILSLSAMCAISNSAEEAWFISKLSNMIPRPDVAGVHVSEKAVLDNLTDLQRRFFYHEAVYAPRAETLAKKLALVMSTPYQEALD